MKRKIVLYICALFCLLPTVCMSFLSVAAAPNNIALGMAYTVTTSVPTVYSYDRYDEKLYDVDLGQLTDGIKAQGAQDRGDDSDWYRAYRSRSRLVTFDFDEPVSVSGFSAGFFHGDGYTAPRYVHLRLSENGMDWFTAGTVEPSFSLNASEQYYEASLTLKWTYAARYVQIEFCCDNFVCCDEIEVYGSLNTSGNNRSIIPDEQPAEGSYCDTLKEQYGISDIVKLYNGYYPADQNSVRNTAEALLPYVAYLNADGQVQDTMFDAVAFVPCVSTNFSYPSGGTLLKTEKYPSAVQSDWIFYTDFLFEKGYELDALDTAVGQVYSQLGIRGKLPVLLTMPYPGIVDKPFGDVDEDGEIDYCKTLSERVAVVEWYDRYLTQRFADAHFSNLDFVGYYWYEEEVGYTWSADEKQFTTDALQALKDAGKFVLFDSSYLSSGFDHWEELGFEGAVMQPNVAFSESRSYFDLAMLREFAVTAYDYHLGVEIETNEPGFFLGSNAAEAIRNYERYLYVGWKTGYMNALHTFYQSSGPGTLYTFCHSDSARLRRLYDITYQFIKGSYSNEPPTVTLAKQAQVYAGQRNIIDLSVQDMDSFGGDLNIVISDCEHGRAEVAASRSALLYIPDDGFTGTDTVTLTVDDQHNESVSYTVKLTVVEAPEGYEPPALAEDSTDSDPVVSISVAPTSDKKKGGLPTWVILTVVAAALIASAALAMIAKQRM